MFYVYADYTQEEIPRPFYVGKGNVARLKDLKRNKKHTEISKKFGINRIILFETKNELLSLEREKDFIRDLETSKSKSEIGCNSSVGGEGFSRGNKRLNEKQEEKLIKLYCDGKTTRELSTYFKLDKSQISRIIQQYIPEEERKILAIQHQTGWKHTDESREKMRGKRQGLSLETRQKMSAARRNKPKSKEWVKAVSGTNNHSAKFSTDDIKTIKILFNDGMSRKELAIKYKVSRSSIERIIKEKTYKGV